MRYRIMATYRGVPYEAGIGSAGTDVVLFAACPPPEELGFEPAPGHWRKRVVRAEVDALWESRPVGIFRGQPCLVLDDLGDRVHIAYLGTDAERAAALGYWQVDRGVFELLAAPEEVTGVAEERIEKALQWSGTDVGSGPVPAYPYGSAPPPAPPPPVPPFPAHPGPAGAEGHGRAGRRPRVTVQAVFCELADLAAIPRTAYALGSEVDGAMCLLAAGEEWEVFVAADGSRREARSFPDEESAYFYLFGVLAAEAVRSGGLAPH